MIIPSGRHWKRWNPQATPRFPFSTTGANTGGTLTEGDLLWAMKNMCYMDMRQAEARRVMEIARRKDNVPVRVTTSMHELVERASNQNFVPVVDDKDAFIGLITRKAIIRYCREKLFPED